MLYVNPVIRYDKVVIVSFIELILVFTSNLIVIFSSKKAVKKLNDMNEYKYIQFYISISLLFHILLLSSNP